MFFDNAPKKVVVYCRVSSDKQEERQSIQNQIDFAISYCKLNNIELQHIYKDDGITGTLPLGERPEGAQLISDAKQGKFNLVLVYKLDRLGRATRIILNAIHDLDGYGVKVRSMTEPFDTADASGRFLVTILAGVADLERSNILQRMELGATRAAKEGKFLGGQPPYGYKINKEGHYEPNYDLIEGLGMSEVDVIRLMYDMACEGKSTVRIANKLNSLGVPLLTDLRDTTKTSDRGWINSTVYRMLKKPVYIGVRQYGKEKIKSNIPAIISKEKYDMAQHLIAKNKSMIKGNVKHNYLLRGLIKCAHCGYAYVGNYNHGKHGYYVDTGNRHWRKKGLPSQCFGKIVPLTWIENAVWNICLGYIRNPHLVEKKINGEINQSEKIKKEIALIRSKLASNDVENQRLIELYKRGLVGIEDVSTQFEKVKKEKESLQVELSTLQGELDKELTTQQIDTAINSLELLRQKLDRPDIDFELKRFVVQTMINRINIDSSNPNQIAATVHLSFGDIKSAVLCDTSSRGWPHAQITLHEKIFYEI
jgi:site-specific DNA recombinase